MTFSSKSNNCPACVISLILPVYNAGSCIRACLKSIVNQEFDGAVEVILVDDCSTDDSATVCQEFVRQYPQLFNLIECKVNAGVSVARNIGLEMANGTYIMFVDSDDVLPPHSLKSLVHATETHNADIVNGNIAYLGESSSQFAPDRILKRRILRD
jgi:glycosyltransferase involved in cell wall biosynthesis